MDLPVVVEMNEVPQAEGVYGQFELS